MPLALSFGDKDGRRGGVGWVRCGEGATGVRKHGGSCGLSKEGARIAGPVGIASKPHRPRVFFAMAACVVLFRVSPSHAVYREGGKNTDEVMKDETALEPEQRCPRV